MEITSITGQALLLLNVALLGMVVARLSRIDVTLCCLATGFALGQLLPYLSLDSGIRAGNIRELVFYLLLPPLIFYSGWHIRPRQLRRWLGLILLLAIVGLIVSTLSTAALTYIGIGHPTGFPWAAALLAGIMLAATDPVSVTAQLRQARAPQELDTLIEGESLFNDATAIVLFTAILELALNGHAGLELGAGLQQFFSTFTGGLLAGVAAGLITAILVLLLQSPAATNFTLVLAAFSSFYVGEHLLGVSGVMTVLGMTLVSRACLRSHEQEFMRSAHDTWDWIGGAFNALVFTLMGLVITPAMFSDRWLAMLIAIVATLLARAVTVYAITALSSRARRDMPANWKPVLVWGGLRGSIAIVLVLSLPLELEYWWTLQSMVFGVVLFSLLVQGSSMKWLLHRLRVAVASDNISR